MGFYQENMEQNRNYESLHRLLLFSVITFCSKIPYSLGVNIVNMISLKAS